MSSDPRVGHLLIRWQQLRTQGRTLTADELCADCPELHDAVDQQIRTLTALEASWARAHPGLDATPNDKGEEFPTHLAGPKSTRPAVPDDLPDSAVTLRTPAIPPTEPPAVVAGTVVGTLKPPSGDAPTRPAPAAPPTGGRTMRGYRMFERLGGGTFGVVYRALSSGGVEVAIKEIHYSLGHPQAQRELEALELIKGLRHPYLLSLHDFWVENDRLYMAMELADGTLAQMIADSGPKGMYQAEALPVFEQAAAALDFLHQHHVLHRDVKPANILVLAGFAKVADLGLAKFHPEGVAVSQNAAGTVAYMAPETCRNEFRPAGDQYALALCYAEARLGRQVCEGTNMPAAIHWHIYATPDLKGLSPREEKAVRRALSKNPADRFPSCQEFVRALREPVAPPSSPARRWWPALAALLVLPILALVVWRLWPARPMGFDPEKHGFSVPPGEPLVQVEELWYYTRIVKKVGDEEVGFLLIPKEKPEDPRTFYMMENKVSHGEFATAAADPQFQNKIKELQAAHPEVSQGPDPPNQWGKWMLGGVRDAKYDLNPTDPHVPVLRVNALEAWCFAHWIDPDHGNLPSQRQWERAAGKGRVGDQPQIYRNPDKPLELHAGVPNAVPDVAINRPEGPLEVGVAKRDMTTVSLRPEWAGRGCHDMAGNGIEWTRDCEDNQHVGPELHWPSEGLTVYMRGRSYNALPFAPKDPRQVGPWSFESPEPSKDFTKCYPTVGFRVVIEP